MEILILAGSPHSHGTSELLVREFQRGAEEAGHEVEIFHAGKAQVHGCTGCNYCEYGKNSCVFRDDMDVISSKLVSADLIVFVSPIYYWGISSQLKATIDRWQPLVFSMQGNKAAMLLTTQASGEDWVTEPVDAWYQALLHFMRWQSIGRIAAKGVPERSDIEKTDYPQLAYELGRQLLERSEQTLCQ